ncbi:IS21 family transposase [Streptomyces sp. URMC 129]|uniref:IS21 family transposase n=1 Tax=Streptomyces sp. URMC 129 TaxID=3423407 RepID=UPI003F1C0381
MKKSAEEVIQILVAYDATQCAHAAAKMVGCDPKTVRRYVAARDTGRPVAAPIRRPRLTDMYVEKVEEWVDRSQGRLSAARAHERLVSLGYDGTDRTTRRLVAEAKARWRAGVRRTYRPWVPEPGLWLEFRWTQGPTVPGPDGQPRRTSLFHAWLPWSRFRVVLPSWDRTLPSLVCCLDTALRAVGGVPAHLLTAPGAGAGIRHSDLTEVGLHYGAQARARVPYTPDSMGDGRWAEIRIAPGDLVPIGTDLRQRYTSFAALRSACALFTERVNTGNERITMERRRLNPLPSEPCALALGRRRTVNGDRAIAYGARRYPLPPSVAGRDVWIRAADGELVVVADLAGPTRLAEVARHRLPARTLRERTPARAEREG